MFEPSAILAPIMILVLWSFVMMFWMAGTRLPAIPKLKLGRDVGKRTKDLGEKMPPHIQWKADNYNHLMEQPTIFYATALVLAMLGAGEGLNLILAWFYVGGRIVHSLVHATTNVVLVRFGLFLVTSLALLIMAIRACLIIF
ncbi:MAG: MAPEG family protein [Zhongshania sp.]|uniref:MAPEG family protein n=1 Tax=Zhongshania sp. TaxID=1971902 RepID=UPI00261654D4|nr:MAPEG family protein [Zhongshania sp.]MDF1693927.1 MAPEG family protein [Zhongshania sp.]